MRVNRKTELLNELAGMNNHNRNTTYPISYVKKTGDYYLHSYFFIHIFCQLKQLEENAFIVKT